jgi:16S rRNA C1402 N4-methylase RsmH
MTGQGARSPHLPVLLGPLLRAVAPISGVWLDGTFGAGGYARGLLEAGADVVIGVDRDPLAFEMARDWASDWGDRLILVPGTFSELDEHAATAGYPALDGVTLDLGVSSMQLDRAERGFSFLRDGPLDMRMGQDGAVRRRSRQRRARGAPGRHHPLLRGGARRPPHRPRHRGRAREGAHQLHPATGGNR